jgi:hypothetical protein
MRHERIRRDARSVHQRCGGNGDNFIGNAARESDSLLLTARIRQRAASGGMSEAGMVLAMPDWWIVDAATRMRLHRRLASAGPECTAVVAEWSDLPPGTSHRVNAERRALASEVQPLGDLAVRGAAMVRPGVSFEVGDDFVKVGQGGLLVDRGATVHDPWSPVGALEDASPLGRPLQHRPVVLFLGLERDPYLADWVRRLVNDLVRRDVEGRIAVPAPTGGLHLTKPCAPTQESLRALEPEVIVALDDAAVEQCAAWVGRRRFGLVRLTQDTTAAVAIGSAPAGRWRHRVEARIGRGIDPASMADLAHELVP